MAELTMTNTSTLILDANNNSDCRQSIVKKKFEKLKTKLVELFFSSTPSQPPTTTVNTTTATPRQITSRKSSTILIEPLNNTITNYYYGYKSHLDDEESETQLQVEIQPAKGNKKNKKSAASSTDKSIIANDAGYVSSSVSDSSKSASQQPVANKIMIDSMYDTSSLNTNNFDSLTNSTDCCHEIFSTLDHHHNSYSECPATNNPFLDPELTNQIALNSDLDTVFNLFEPYMHLIDDQDNFFDVNFMTNYIAYILLVKIKTSDFASQYNIDLRSSPPPPPPSSPASTNQNNSENAANDSTTSQYSVNMLKEISRQIYLESESEPCGLKGCKLSIFLETNKPVENNNNESQNYLLTQFRFDSTCSLTTFELNLFLKQQDISTTTTTGALCNNTNTNSTSTSSFATLTKRFLNRKSKSLSDGESCYSENSRDNSIYLDPISYNLFKCKLY